MTTTGMTANGEDYHGMTTKCPLWNDYEWNDYSGMTHGHNLSDFIMFLPCDVPDRHVSDGLPRAI